MNRGFTSDMKATVCILFSRNLACTCIFIVTIAIVFFSILCLEHVNGTLALEKILDKCINTAGTLLIIEVRVIGKRKTPL